MSVFTPIDMQQLGAFLKAYPVGAPTDFTGIEAGITNSNYFIDTETGRYVLTIVEHESFEDVEWFMQLLAYLYDNKIPCAKPLRSGTGLFTNSLADKPATVVQCLQGGDKSGVNSEDCFAIGQVLARLHKSCQHYEFERADSRGAQWRQGIACKVQSKLTGNDQQVLQHHMDADYADTLAGLPHSVIHADLFRDNVLFDQGSISGIIDFYYACNGCMVYDLAITFNDWCRDDTTRVDRDLAGALLKGYESVRPLEAKEQLSWQDAVRCAALRFWLSRLFDLYFPPEALMTFTKDPAPFQKILSEDTLAYVDLTS